MKDYIVDACVAAKWLIAESDTERAQLLILGDYFLRAPDLIMPEIASVFLKRVRRQELTLAECRELLQRFVKEYLDVRIRTIPSRLFVEEALQIAATEGCSIYDSLYLACAVQAGCPLITADEKFVHAIKNQRLKRHVVALRVLQLPC